MKIILIKSLLLILIFQARIYFAQDSEQPKYLKNKAYILQTELYKIYRTEKADVVMLGNSITQGINWAEALARPYIVNRGINSDILEGFISRLDNIIKLSPKLCFIMGGINDIYNDSNIDTIFASYTTLILKLCQAGIKPIVQSTLYVNPKWKRADEKNREVKILNEKLETYCRENSIDYIDLNSEMSENCVLKDENTYDGVHLTAEGYGSWLQIIEKELIKNGL